MSDLKDQKYEKTIKTSDGFVIGITKDGEKDLIKYVGESTNVVIPDYIKHIKANAFKECKSVQEIEIPPTVTQIGAYAFHGCSNLKYIWIPSNANLTSIGNDAFGDCRSLCIISLPKGITTIEDGVFRGCESIRRIEYLPNDNIDSLCYIVEIPPTVTQIGNDAFYGCRNLVSVEIPPTVTQIGNNAFCECKELVSVEIPLNVTRIGNSAFSGCKKLDNVKIPPTVTQIGDSAFYGTALKSIKIPKGIDSIKDKTFYNCAELSSVEIPESVTSIGKEAFTGCRKLFSIKLPARIENIGKNALSCLHLTKARCFNINFDSSTSNISLNELYAEFPNGIIRNKDNLPIYFEGNNTATQILKQIFKKTATDKVKTNILDKYNEAAFLENIVFLNEIILTNNEEFNIDKEQQINIIANIFAKNPQLLQFNIKETLIENYKYLVKQNILTKEELDRYYFGFSDDNEKDIDSYDLPYITKMLKAYFKNSYRTANENEIPPLFSTLVVESTAKNRLELRDRLLIASLAKDDDKEAALKGNSFETICRNDERDFSKERNVSSETFFKGYDMFKGIKTSLYRKLNGINSDLVNDLNNLAKENIENIFTDLLNSLETVKNWNNFSSEIERAKFFRNEFIGRILYAYLKILKQQKNTSGNIDFTKPETLKMELFYNKIGINCKDIIREATKSQKELFNDPELIKTMLMIHPYSYDALRNYCNKEYNEFSKYADFAKDCGYFFNKTEKKDLISQSQTPSFIQNLRKPEATNNFIEYVNNQIGFSISLMQREEYLTAFEKIIKQYIYKDNDEYLMELLRMGDFFCRSNHEIEFQDIQGYDFSSESLFNFDGDFNNEDRIMYLLFFMNKLAHNNKDINLMALIKDDYRFEGYGERQRLLGDAIKGFNFLGPYGLTPTTLIRTLSANDHSNMKNKCRAYFEKSLSAGVDETIELWSGMCKLLFKELELAQGYGEANDRMFNSEEELNSLIDTIKNITDSDGLQQEEKEKIKMLLDQKLLPTNPTASEQKILDLIPEKDKETLKKIKNIIFALLPISRLNKQEIIEIESISREYEVLFDVKIILASKLIEDFKNRIQRQLKPVLLLGKEGKKRYYKKHGYIIEIQQDDKNNPILVCLNKKFNKPFSIHLKDLPQELATLIQELIKPVEEIHTKIETLVQEQNKSQESTPEITYTKMETTTQDMDLKTIAHTRIETSSQYPMLKRQPSIITVGKIPKLESPITSGFNELAGNDNCQLRDYLVSIYNCATYDYDESMFIKEQLSDKKKYLKTLFSLFNIIEDRAQKSSTFATTKKIFRDFILERDFGKSGIDEMDSNQLQEYQRTIADIFNRNCLDVQELLFGTDKENDEKLEQLVKLYRDHNPDMVEIVSRKNYNGVEQQYICVSLEVTGESGKGRKEQIISIDRFSSEFITEIKDRKQSESQTQSETQEDTPTTSPIEPNVQTKRSEPIISSLNIDVPSTISAIAESKNDMVINRGQVQGNANSNTQNKPPSM